ncbi:NAD(P)-dependent oxidoreductase [Bacillus sp. FJAT-44742]|uniref:NAD(P)-dependent oxidoreductase n=1 Tax=Bacillus sp. FJAT-44742 TaxID=2014005 RepID=UPI000C240838|nr:NAD(P)-dependent oxidoreductase [Bacillus sp. FJAT-44742]
MTKLAYIGLGNMGLPMAVNLVKAGYEVYGKNRSQGKEEKFAGQGGKVGKSVSQLAKEADVVMTCLPMPDDVENMILGKDGLLEHAKEGLTIIDFSTVSPELNVKIYEQANEKGVHFLDAPISGGTTGAEAATLAIMVGGDEKVFQEVTPILETVGENITYAGPSGSGTKVKLINQYFVGMHTMAVSEAMHLATEAGIDRDLLYSVLSKSFAQSRIYDRHYPDFIAKEQYTPGFALELLHKDLRLMSAMAEEANVSLEFGQSITKAFAKAEEMELGKEDMSALYKYVKSK